MIILILKMSVLAIECILLIESFDLVIGYLVFLDIWQYTLFGLLSKLLASLMRN